jgi:hypothetical protein
MIAGFIEIQQRAGRLRESDPHQSATLFHDMITFDLLYRTMSGDEPCDDEIRQRIDMTIDVFLHGSRGDRSSFRMAVCPGPSTLAVHPRRHDLLPAQHSRRHIGGSLLGSRIFQNVTAPMAEISMIYTASNSGTCRLSNQAAISGAVPLKIAEQMA